MKWRTVAIQGLGCPEGCGEGEMQEGHNPSHSAALMKSKSPEQLLWFSTMRTLFMVQMCFDYLCNGLTTSPALLAAAGEGQLGAV